MTQLASIQVHEGNFKIKTRSILGDQPRCQMHSLGIESLKRKRKRGYSP